MQPSQDISRLLEIMAALRDKTSGCPWDIEQTFSSIAPYALEEACEVMDAITKKDMNALKEELGDLLLQVVFHAQIAKEKNLFDFGDVVEAITSKLIRRHPHIFEKQSDLSAQDVKKQWDKIKATEKPKSESILNSVSASLPPMRRALHLQKVVAKKGFDWDNEKQIIDKIYEEIQEFEDISSENKNRKQEEIGDIIFSIINLSRHNSIDPDMALSKTNEKFITRFSFIERELKDRNICLENASLGEMEELWQQAKQEEQANVE